MDNSLDVPSAYNLMSKVEQEGIQWWIYKNFWGIQSTNPQATATQLKYYFEQTKPGFYVSSGMIEGALIAAGYRADKNGCFNISQKAITKLLKSII